ncbi:putative membrane protein [Xanthomonas oryzae pv. oryzicola BLS256]|uniref:Putative membrane protein n=1 Tax=Xanthomonas oryzae pv. oryzicola (strain BLS256) TaxID=383407 RepID=G7TJL9_XANOB|nr:putative membrane protein [Xanthomonas oryzae pv. oryzicola BLS256]QEO99805.1 putative membrane protein [Xanthomonas oryzae pv. oryzicola]
MRQGQAARDAGCPCCDESPLPDPKSPPPRDKLIAHLVLAFLVSGICAVLLRVIRMHGALKALINLLCPRLWSAPW